MPPRLAKSNILLEVLGWPKIYFGLRKNPNKHFGQSNISRISILSLFLPDKSVYASSDSTSIFIKANHLKNSYVFHGDDQSVQFSCSVMFDSLQPHELQQAGPPCPSPTSRVPEFTQTHVHRVSDAIQPCHPRSSPSPPAPNPSQHQSLSQ